MFFINTVFFILNYEEWSHENIESDSFCVCVFIITMFETMKNDPTKTAIFDTLVNDGSIFCHKNFSSLLMLVEFCTRLIYVT